jgi:hypothetical protein
MQIEIVKDSEVLGQADFREVMEGVYVCLSKKCVVILETNDIGLLVELAN